LVEWLARLTCPGVLVLGQPLFSPPEGYVTQLFGKPAIISDLNLPAFRPQFQRLVRVLQYAPHDVLVLAGDVHFGRIARVQPFRLDGLDASTLFEVIASPMAQLPGANSAFYPDESEGPRNFPANPRDFVPGVLPAAIEWIDTVPTKSDTYKVVRRPLHTDFAPTPDEEGGVVTPDYTPDYPDYTDRGLPDWVEEYEEQSTSEELEKVRVDRTEEHFMTLAFTNAGNGNVHVQVSAWLIRRPPRADGLPHRAWQIGFTLRRKGGLDIPGARSLLLEQEDISGARSLLTDNGKEE
jgi:hypothetical protein